MYLQCLHFLYKKGVFMATAIQIVLLFVCIYFIDRIFFGPFE